MTTEVWEKLLEVWLRHRFAVKKFKSPKVGKAQGKFEVDYQ